MRCKAKITLLTGLAVCVAASLFGCGGTVESPDIKPHLTAAQNKQTVAIDGFEGYAMPPIAEGGYRDRVELLYNTVVYDGKRPVFVDDDPVRPIYDAAYGFLSTYVQSDGGEQFELNAVHAIHDWLIYATDYDFLLYESYKNGNTELSDDPAFYIDGVLLNGKAVCDGLARTFNFLCAMEGIESVRVTGSFASATHAWNKVNIGGDWYNIDVTADTVNYSVGNKNYKQISHGYFLLSDKTLREFKPNGHDFSESPLVAEKDIDFCATDPVTIGGKTRSRVIISQKELNAVFADIRRQKGRIGKIELKLDFDGKLEVNGADMYKAEIKRAYDKVDDVSFKFTESSKPYFRYPNGVYVFLIYK